MTFGGKRWGLYLRRLQLQPFCVDKQTDNLKKCLEATRTILSFSPLQKCNPCSIKRKDLCLRHLTGFQRVADPLVRLERVSKGKTVAAEGCLSADVRLFVRRRSPVCPHFKCSYYCFRCSCALNAAVIALVQAVAPD